MLSLPLTYVFVTQVTVFKRNASRAHQTRLSPHYFIVTIMMQTSVAKCHYTSDRKAIGWSLWAENNVKQRSVKGEFASTHKTSKF